MGLGELFGAVTQELQGGLPFIRKFFVHFFHVGLCFSIDSQVTWHRKERQIKACRIAHVDLMDLSLLYWDHTHVTNWQLSISLVKSDARDVTAKIEENMDPSRGDLVHLVRTMCHHHGRLSILHREGTTPICRDKNPIKRCFLSL